jgi:hypothetical protein
MVIKNYYFLLFYQIYLRFLNLNFFDYDKNISYLGSWKYNNFRTKLNIHKILPFNFEAFKHDKRYYLLFRLEYNLFIVLIVKLIIDLFFLYECLKISIEINLIKMFFKMIFALICFLIVVLMTPIYYFRYKKK